MPCPGCQISEASSAPWLGEKNSFLPTSFQTATGVELKKKNNSKTRDNTGKGKRWMENQEKNNPPVLVTCMWRRFLADCTLLDKAQREGRRPVYSRYLLPVRERKHSVAVW